MIVFGFLPLLRMYFREVRQTLRRLGNNRRFSCSVILTLALGIGATVSVFSIIHAVMITPLPYDDPSRLFSVFAFHEKTGRSQYNSSLASLNKFFSPAEWTTVAMLPSALSRSDSFRSVHVGRSDQRADFAHRVL
jgi:hypothetical protein